MFGSPSCAIAPNSASCCSALMPGAATWFLSWLSPSAGSQCRMSQNDPVSRKFAALTSAPTSPVSPATPESALSNLLTSSIWRTPSLCTSSSCRSMSAIEQAGTSSFDRAAERHAGLDAHDHRHLPGVDHLPGLERVRDDPVEALARPAELGVDVVLHLVHVAGLEPDRVHVVARVPLERVELAELVVLDEQVHEDPLAAAPRPLQPPVVGALVGQRVGRRPVLERRPADRVVVDLPERTDSRMPP